MYDGKDFEAGEEPDCNYLLWKKTKKRMDERIFGLKSASGVTACVSVAKTLMANYTLEFDTKGDLFGCVKVYWILQRNVSVLIASMTSSLTRVDTITLLRLLVSK